jgi:hypothetical protein
MDKGNDADILIKVDPQVLEMAAPGNTMHNLAK